MLSNGSSRADAEAFDSLAKVFRSSGTLETLNLSDNNLRVSQTGSIWENWSCHRKLRQLILDYVAMDDESLEELASNFTFADSLEELYVVLTKNVSPRGLDAANSILKACTKVSSLRWAVRDAPPTAKLPWCGLAKMAENSAATIAGSKLMHLVMDGGTITNVELNDICTAFRYFSHLKTVKLRSIGIQDEGAKRLSESLLVSKPPLENLDLSRNDIRTSGAAAIAKISLVENITKSLSLLALDRNRIEAGGARTVLEAFGSRGDPKLEIKLDGNPFHYGKLAFNLACRKGQAENERNELRRDVERMRSDMLDTSVSNNANADPQEVRMLQDEVLKLREEKKSLMAAFSIFATPEGVESQSQLMARVTSLEKTVFGSSSHSLRETGDNNDRRRSSISSQSSNHASARAAARAASAQDADLQTSPSTSISGRSTVSGSALTVRRMSSTSTSLPVASPRRGRTMRESMRDLVSPMAQNTRNSMQHGSWPTSPSSKKSVTIAQQYRYSSPPRCRDLDDGSSVKSGSQSRTAAAHPNQREFHFTPAAYP